MLAYFSTPEIMAEKLGRRIDEVLEFINVGIGTKEEREITYFLDASPHPVLDKNPGKISGDCTDGRPLPFRDPNIPVYNVKVFDHTDRHIGNIYLLVTETTDGNKVWHLDAIQIPKKNLNWEESISRIIETISEKAREKGVNMITVNSEDNRISNYGYIEMAVETYWWEKGCRRTIVYIPEVKNRYSYSEFQGRGDALVLWEEN